MDYRQAGVDIEAGEEVVRHVRELARSTFSPEVLSDIGAFGGLFRLDVSACDDPVLVASADGVGTKLKVAVMAGEHRSVGLDLVNHCVNDVLVQGARPLFFLDYFATGRLAPSVAVQVLEGIARGCRENGCALLGGETAEMPGFYAEGEYDLAGFIVGLVSRRQLVDGSSIVPGDVLIGLPSSGLHTNGYSLARRILFDELRLTVDSEVEELNGSVAHALLVPHRSYLRLLQPLLAERLIKGMAHITGGGITGNLPRVLPQGTAASIARRSWQVPAIFHFLQRNGHVTDDDMYRTFNMGIGLILVVNAEQSQRVLELLSEAGAHDVRVIGRIIRGGRTVAYTDS